MEFRYGLYFLAILFPSLVQATVFMTVPEALQKAFPSKAVTEKKEAFLTVDQIRKANEQLEYKMDERGTVVTYFEAFIEGKSVGWAYLDSDRVRKETETLMIVLSPDHQIKDVEILSFNEPKDYLPTNAWKKQFEGKGAHQLNSSKGSIAAITGATLTSKAMTKSVQKILAVDQIIHP